MIINIAVLDDKIFDYEIIKSYINNYAENKIDNIFNLSYFDNSADLFIELNNKIFDIIFMDIMLLNENGIDITREINIKFPNIQIIYQSGEASFFQNVYQTKHTYFLVKPIEYSHFSLAMDKVISDIKIKYIYIDVDGRVRLFCSDIVYIESFGREINIHTNDGRLYSIRKSLISVENMLPEYFIRCHKSFIINADYIKEYKCNSHFILSSTFQKEIAIGRKFGADTDRRLTSYWGKRVI